MAASSPRKTPARRTTAPAGARRPKPAAPEAIDILGEFATNEKPPVPIKVGTIDAEVRRGFSGDEAVEFFRLIGAMEFEAALELITNNGAALWERIGKLAPDHCAAALNRIIGLSELHEGNLLAPLPGYAINPAGAPPSPLSTDTTG